MKAAFDHIVIGCADLEAAIPMMSETLGAAPAGRGVHTKMSTHNALWGMGDAYLELVAIDPAAPHPGRPRWFGLDDAATQARLADGPALLTWAASVSDLDACRAAAPAPMGEVETFARDDLQWRLSVPEAGTPPMDGAYPLTIEWTSGLHPAKRLPDVGLRCARFAICHPEAARLRAALGEIGAPVEISEGAASMTAELTTPAGPAPFTA